MFRGRNRYLYEYGGRRFDWATYWNRRNAEREARVSSRPPPEVVTKPSQLKITDIEVEKHLLKNRHYHHTDDYDSKELILRRGQPFEFDVTLDRAYNKETDKLYVEFRTGKTPSYTKGTKVRASLSDKLEDDKWGVSLDSDIEGKVLRLKVQSSCNAPVGYYNMSVITNVKDADEFSFPYFKRVYILFNPWCKEDATYMEGKEEKDEYVLNDTGYLWYGNYRQMGYRPWNFGQFEEGVFDAVMYLLQDSKEPVMDRDRSNPVIVARKMSAAVNVQDEGGVLHGRWDGKYDDGKRPTFWNGSVAILEQYMKEKEPVKYGQCWVFSGVLTTVLRCLGIPARSVTNFASAHDTDNSMTIDKYLDEEGEPLEYLESDSVWNFHVWNDCWMARPDLPPGYGGWQAVDATPQETSEGIFQTGPSSLNAIKQGHVYLPYDARFVFAEINADRVYWEAKEDYATDDYTLTKISLEKWAIGRYLYTKAVGRNQGVDVKGDYKFPEGTDEERLAVESAIQYGTKPDTYSPDSPFKRDVDFKVETADLCYVGSDFEVEIPLINRSAEERNVNLFVSVQVCYYTGVLGRRVKKERVQVKLPPNGQEKGIIKVSADEYLDKLVDQSAMKIFVMGKVKETWQLLAGQDDFRLRTPDLDVTVDKQQLKVNEEFTAKISLKNPLPKTLTNCEFSLEGAGLQNMMELKQDDIAPHAEVTREVKLRTRKAGKRTLVVDFDSDQLSQVHGDVEIEVKA